MSSTRPGRPREFAEETALEALAERFRERGFEGASYADLEAATGVHRASLRNAFGAKDAMHSRAVEHYARAKTLQVESLLDGSASALDGLRAVFELWAGDLDHASGKGCLLVVARAELEADSDLAAVAVETATRRLLDALEAAFARALDGGEIPTGHDPALLAASALALADGFMLHRRSPALEPKARAAFALFLSSLRHRPPAAPRDDAPRDDD